MPLVVRLDCGLDMEKENGGKKLAVVDVDEEKRDGKELAMELVEENMGKVFAVDVVTEFKVVGKVLTKTVGVGMDDEDVDMEVGELVGSFSPRVLPWPGKGSLSTSADSASARRRD